MHRVVEQEVQVESAASRRKAAGQIDATRRESVGVVVERADGPIGRRADAAQQAQFLR